MASLLVLGLVAGGSFFALRNPPRHGPRYGSGPSHRPQSQSDSVIAQTTLPVESEIAASKLIATAKTAESTNIAVPSNTAAPINVETSLDWSRFRGPNGTGVSMDATIPTQARENWFGLWKPISLETFRQVSYRTVSRSTSSVAIILRAVWPSSSAAKGTLPNQIPFGPVAIHRMW